MAEHGQMLKGASTNQRNQSGAEPWDCGRNDTVVPLSLFLTLQCISLCIYAVFYLASILGLTNYGQKQDPDYPAQCFAEIMLLHFRNFTSSQAGNGNQVKQSSSSALSVLQQLFLVSPLLLCCSPSARRHWVSTLCVLVLTPAFQGQPFPGLSLPQHFLSVCSLSMHWDTALLCPQGLVAVLGLLSCP